MTEVVKNTGGYNQYLSFVDLERDPEFVVAWKEQDQEKVESLLYKYGCDLEYGYEVEVCLHRPRTMNSAEYGPRFSFKSRVDKEWHQYMTTEELIEVTADPFLRAELMGMSQQSNFSGDLMSKGEAEGTLEDEVVTTKKIKKKE